MKLGLVSNCWRIQLAKGELLVEMLQELSERELSYVELRQSCLGEFETEDRVPLPDRLATLPEKFPDVGFNLALEYPFLDPQASDKGQFAIGVEAALSLDSETPHLRLVDLATRPEATVSIDPARVAMQLASLATQLSDQGGWLTVEHSIQPWGWFRDCFNEARRMLDDAASLRLCFDPCNLLLEAEPEDPVPLIDSLQPDCIALFHLKQRHAGRIQPSLCSGEVDWRAVAKSARKAEIDCPWLWEVDSSEQVWEELVRSRAYLEACLAGD